MAAIKSKDTTPELVVRSIAHRLGYRFRTNRKDLLGKPDLVFSSRRKIIMVHGCYWHMHSCKYGRVVPATNTNFWQAKRIANSLRDKKVRRVLRNKGWGVLAIWECQTKNLNSLVWRIANFIET